MSDHAEAMANKSSEYVQRQISTREMYFASLNSWVKHANISQNAMALFPWYLLNSYPQIFQNHTAEVGQGFQNNQQIPNTNGAGGLEGLRILDDRSQSEIINRNGGYEVVIASFWKRALAEIADVLILLLLKVIVTFTIMNIFDLDLGFDLDKEVLRKAFDDDDYSSFFAMSMEFLAFSSDLLMLEVLTKVIACFYEAIWTTVYGGATPGKALLNIRILYVEALVPMQPQQLELQAQRVQMRALIFPAETPSFKRAFSRAVAKNLIMTLLFPMCFVMIFFKNNRTAYDIITKTIVVEGNANSMMLRR